MTGQRSRLPLFETLGTARCCSVDLAHTFTHRTLAIHRLTLIIRAPKAVVEVPASEGAACVVSAVRAVPQGISLGDGQ
jgi:hypothetical protein